jgi:hypothetical protein
MNSVGSACLSLTYYNAASGSFNGIFSIYLAAIPVQSSTIKQLLLEGVVGRPLAVSRGKKTVVCIRGDFLWFPWSWLVRRALFHSFTSAIVIRNTIIGFAKQRTDQLAYLNHKTWWNKHPIDETLALMNTMKHTDEAQTPCKERNPALCSKKLMTASCDSQVGLHSPIHLKRC